MARLSVCATPERAYLPWACGVARNIVRNHARKFRRDRVFLSDSIMEELAEAEHRRHDDREQRFGFLMHCLQLLPQSQRELIERCYLGRESIKSVASQLSLKPAALYKRLDRIRGTVLECIQKSSGEDKK